VKTQTQPMQLLTSHQSADWYTPPRFIELAREVLGEIDLDPASAALPQTWIRAGRYYTEAEDGLAQPWRGKVFLNPPYGTGPRGSNQAVWSERLVTSYRAGEVEAAVLLVNSTHGYGWYERLWSAWPCCLARERIAFLRADGTPGGQAKRGQTFVYLGRETERFAEAFGGVGRVLLPDPAPEEQPALAFD
jgi:hypothetical protein